MYSRIASPEKAWPQVELQKLGYIEQVQYEFTYDFRGFTSIVKVMGHLKSCVTPPISKSSSSSLSSPSSEDLCQNPLHARCRDNNLVV